MQQHNCMVANILFAHPLDSECVCVCGGGGGQSVKIHFFSEHGHVAYQIKGNDACSNMVANILTADPSPPPDPWGLVKIQLFQNMVILYIKHAATWK